MKTITITRRARRSVAALAAAGLVLAACGGDDASPQDQVADIVIDAAADAGASPDSDCIRDEANKLSDSEAQLLVDAGFGPGAEDPGVSEETNEILAQMLLC